MNLMKFTILAEKDTHTQLSNEIEILINVDHVATVKPIKIIIEGEVIDGFWIRTTIGKKYRATKIPDSLKKLLN